MDILTWIFYSWLLKKYLAWHKRQRAPFEEYMALENRLRKKWL